MPSNPLRTLLFTLILACALPALAGRPYTVAIQGHDPVAYFSAGRPTPGDLRFSHHWNGANWLFASAANRDRFIANPAAFAPRYDGYCAYAASQGYMAPGDPGTWTIVDGKLYLNFSAEARKLWEKDIPGHIAQADNNWPGLNPD